MMVFSLGSVGGVVGKGGPALEARTARQHGRGRLPRGPPGGQALPVVSFTLWCGWTQFDWECVVVSWGILLWFSILYCPPVVFSYATFFPRAEKNARVGEGGERGRRAKGGGEGCGVEVFHGALSWNPPVGIRKRSP